MSEDTLASQSNAEAHVLQHLPVGDLLTLRRIPRAMHALHKLSHTMLAMACLGGQIGKDAM